MNRILSFLVLFTLIPNTAIAQIIPDSSLGAENSVVESNGNRDTINGGAIRDANLFHSFQEFNVEALREAYFTNPDGLANIFSRVTGNNISDIQGVLGVLGDANLYLINPNGILFGENARLDVNGSFFATSADSVLFENGFEFSAANPDAPPLLTIDIPIGLRFRDNPGDITNSASLLVNEGENLALIGGNIRLDSGNIFAPGGRVELGGLAETGNVEMNAEGNSLSFNFPEDVKRADVLLTNGALVDVTAEGGGSIFVNANTLEISGTSQLLAGIQEGLGSFDSKAGDIAIDVTETINLTGATSTTQRSSITNVVQSGASGQGGNIRIITGLLSVTEGAELNTSIFGRGNAGNITINARDAVKFESGQGEESSFASSKAISQVKSGAEGQGGEIDIKAEKLSLTDGAFLSVSSSGQGDAGSVSIEARGEVEFDGVGLDNFPSGVYSYISSEEGNAGNLAIDTKHLSVRNGARVSAGTVFGSTGNAGNLTVDASDSVKVIGESSNGNVQSRLTTRTKGSGNAGTLTIDTKNFIIRDGAQVSSGTVVGSTGNAGNLTVEASDSVKVIGEAKKDKDVREYSRLTTRTEGSGNAGTLTIDTKNFIIRDGAQVGSGTSGTNSTGNGNHLTINASDSVQVIGESLNGKVMSRLSPRTEGSGNAGNLTIDTGELLIQDGGQVSTQTLKGTTGNAGNLTINASDSVTVIGESKNNPNAINYSRLTTRTQGSGNAGTLTIDTKNFIVQDGAQVGAVTIFGSTGDGNHLTVNAADLVRVIGTSSTGNLPSRLSTRTDGSGNAGNLTINTKNLFVLDGGDVSAEILNKSIGEGGNLIINASDSVQVIGESFNGEVWSRLTTETLGNEKAGDIEINTPQLIIDRGASISAFTEASGDSGTITINAPQSVILKDGSSLTVETSGAGKPGDIFITTPHLTIGKDSEISATATETSTNTEGGGSITINTSNLDLTGKLGIFAETQSEAPAGTLTIESYQDRGELNIKFTDAAFISTLTEASGVGGDINLTAPETINISGQGKITVETSGSGDAGSINITTENLNISNQTEISASTFGIGKAGGINITAANFNLVEGANLFTNTESSALAGDIQLNITDSINLSNSTIRAGTTEGSTGDGGNIFIDPANMTIQDGAEIAVDSQGRGKGGDITLEAGLLTLDQGTITAETANNQGGDINLILSDQLRLRNNSQITATAGTSEAGGDGGNIKIDAPFIIAFPKENNDITANAFQGLGGNINIITEGIFGLEERSSTPENETNDIDASSQFGLSGEVNITRPDVDPASGLLDLTQEVVDPAELIAQNVCTQTADSEFVDIGKGGLPQNPEELLVEDAIEVELVTPITSSSEEIQLNRDRKSVKPNINRKPPAQGWIFHENGIVELVAYNPHQVGEQRIWDNYRGCQ